ncbi:MAG: AAA family ATPase [Deltaproteobacteria bacterium]|nr:AAA family ATPase [Deltaproteobacteria bacterium]
MASELRNLVSRFPAQDRFTLQYVIGHGGMGVVFAAHDGSRGSAVALKTLQVTSAAAIARLKREFRLVQGLEHPGLVRLGELWADGSDAYFTMELLEGGDLLSWLRGPEGPRLMRFAPALRQLGDALEHLHAAGVVHRDVKPTNVLVRADGRLKLLDFGIAAAEGAGGERAGTPGYVAPEQRRGEPPAPAADWYAVGVLLREALTGARPDQQSTMDLGTGGGSGAGSGGGGGQPGADGRERMERMEGVEGQALGLLLSLADDLLSGTPGRRPGLARLRTCLDAVESALATQVATPTPAPVRSVVPTAATTPMPVTPGSGGPVAGARSGVTRGAFVGRTRELAALREALGRAHRGGTVALVVGSSGSGKTRLVRELLAGQPTATRVLAARCFPLDRVRFNAVDAIVDALADGALGALPVLAPATAATLTRLFPALTEPLGVSAREQAEVDQTVEPFELRARGFQALLELLTALARRTPLVLSIDDLHWADADSVALLQALLAPAQRAPLLLLATTWPEALAEAGALAPLAAALTAGDLRLELGGLGPADTATLVAALAGERDPARAARVFASSGGNPFLVAELTRGAEPDLGAALASRIDPCGALGWALAEIVAIAGAPLPVELALACAGGPGAATAADDALSGLLGARMLRRSAGRAGDEVALQHDRLRAALLARLTASERATRHRELARALEASPDRSPEQLFIHLREAGEGARAAGFAARAAAAAAVRLAFERASELYDAALELGAFTPSERQSLALAAGEAAAGAGLAVRAADHFLAARAGAAPEAAIALAQRAAGHLLQSGQLVRGSALAEQVLANHHIGWPRGRAAVLATTLALRLRLQLAGPATTSSVTSTSAMTSTLAAIDACWSTATGLFFLDPPRGLLFHTHQLGLAQRAGDPPRLARALAGEAVYQASRGPDQLPRANQLLQRARATLRGLDDSELDATIGVAEGVLAYREGRFHAASSQLEQLERRLREQHRNVAWELAVAQRFALMAIMYQGDYLAEARLLPSYQASAQRRGDAFAGLNMRVHEVRLALIHDDAARARRDLAGLLDAWRGRDVEMAKLQELVTRGWLASHDGRHDELAELRRELTLRRLTWVQWAMPHAEILATHAGVLLAQRAGTRGLGRASLDAELASSLWLLGRSPLPWARGWGLAYRGLAAAQPASASHRASADARARGRDLLLRGAALLSSSGAMGWAAAAELHAARLADDADAAARAAASLASRGVRRPLAWATALLPGLPRDD